MRKSNTIGIRAEEPTAPGIRARCVCSNRDYIPRSKAALFYVYTVCSTPKFQYFFSFVSSFTTPVLFCRILPIRAPHGSIVVRSLYVSLYGFYRVCVSTKRCEQSRAILGRIRGPEMEFTHPTRFGKGVWFVRDSEVVFLWTRGR